MNREYFLFLSSSFPNLEEIIPTHQNELGVNRAVHCIKFVDRVWPHTADSSQKSNGEWDQNETKRTQNFFGKHRIDLRHQQTIDLRNWKMGKYGK